MTKPAFRRAIQRIESLTASQPDNPRRRKHAKPVRFVPDAEVVARLKADPDFERYCCKMAGAMKASGQRFTAVEIARMYYEAE